MIEILTSGVALGVHVPGLLLAARLRARAVPVGVSVLERLLPDDKLAVTGRMKQAFHRDFRLARTGRRVASQPADAISEAAFDKLFTSWRNRKVEHFVMFSGFWLPVVIRYRETVDATVRIDLCRVDSADSPSFPGHTPDYVRRIALADAETGTLPYSIPVTGQPPMVWADREPRVLAHGGGWGMGTYRDAVGDLTSAGFAVDVVAYEAADVTDDGVRYFMIDPDWHPWLDDGFPPFGRVCPGEPVSYRRGTDHHGSFDLLSTGMASVSKPGGGTLLDSYWSATPAVLLTPFGPHEQWNADLWESLGFGISLDRWRATGFAAGVLESLHNNLLAARGRATDYAALLASLASARDRMHSA
uniref:UDP-glucuronosyltransferase n=1 Tax=Amycolatopsis sp. SANK 60206 TaxID=1642649 RepID=A0A0E3USN8_9PSEU|nr:hypothetical protein [Amycolatopsis sp. SANK 60206]